MVDQSQNSHNNWSWAKVKLETRTQSKYPKWLPGTHIIEPSPTACRLYVSKKLEFKVELRLNPGILIWDVRVPVGILMV